MGNLLRIFSWVASALVEGLCPGSLLVDNVSEGLRRYNESASKIAEAMQRAWRESIATLQVALGSDSWFSSKSRRHFGEKFAKEVITPFALERNLTGKRLEVYLQKIQEQCEALEGSADEIINFLEFDENTLLEGLSDINALTSSGDDIGGILIERIQNQFPGSRELLELLWHRNLLLEGLIAHFNLELSYNSSLADLVDRMDSQRIQTDLSEVKGQLDSALKKGNFAAMGLLGAKATQLSAANEVYQLENSYQNLLGPIMEKLNKLSDDHETINQKLDQVLSVLSQLQTIQKTYVEDTKILYKIPTNNANVPEKQLTDQLTHLVKNIGWNAIPEKDRVRAAHSLTASFYSSKRISQSLSILEEVIREGIEDGTIYFNYFEALQAVERYDDATEAYKKAIVLSPEMALFPPSRYELIKIIGKGQTAFVYQVFEKETEKEKAIKVLFIPTECEEAKSRFLQAAENAARLKHKSIVEIYEWGIRDNGHACLSMECLKGMDLRQKIQKEGPFSLRQTLEVAQSIGQALQFAREQNVAHRDFKPSNIFYVENDIKIIGFDSVGWANDPTFTLVDESYYRLYYSAPEQLSDFHKVNESSNIYSFGKTLCYILTGEEPYDIEWEDIPQKIRSILRHATRKNSEDRYQSLEEMLSELNKLKSGGIIEVKEDFVESGFFPAFSDRDVLPQTIPPSILKQLEDEYYLKEGQLICKKDKSPMIYVPAGLFLMGDESDEAEIEEAPMHEVFLDAYLMDVYPVTNERYALFLEETSHLNRSQLAHHNSQPSRKIHIPQLWYNREWNQSDYPVVGVDWWDAYVFSQWAGKSLPTEAQWEKAARGIDARYYPWGNQTPPPCLGKLAPVTLCKSGKSPYGCVDMVGNVWEWCYDWYDPTYYQKSPPQNPQGPSSGRCRVVRGGWLKNAKPVRATTRGYGDGPGDRRYHLGFRTVKQISIKEK